MQAALCFVSESIIPSDIIEAGAAMGRTITLEQARDEMERYGRGWQRSFEAMKYEMIRCRVMAIAARQNLGVEA